MPRSDWGDWLVREIEESSPDGVAVWYLGCNGFVLKAADGTTLFIDPYLGTGDPPRTVRMIPVPFDPEDVGEADALLVTHEHTDHVHGESQAPILQNTGATMYAPEDSLDVVRTQEAWHEAWDLTEEQFVDVYEDEVHNIGSFTVNVEPANDPDASHPVSYVIEHEAGTFFHGGDARPGEFAPIGEDYDIDLGVLAFGTVGTIPDKETGEPQRTKWYSDETQIIESANDLRLDRLLPSHWDMWKGLTADPKNLHHHAASFEYPRRLELVEIGDRVDL
ncbi:MBL fold metallo-hydrolase [Halalkalicoccus jeotgali]|uniref:Beta-lactamase domain protein n=1 Tax=Halalkalicoccus jeotgali (strain DSM 18796 / CECT 7217 / JCM 14584 / KCTC 4019 / B3) TaxID=795797 RepID=D8J3P2_HALJB|nr:MBL fold metallo-hydrolase [Halalkalicoccus jeotgali]ADJ15349.1 beta-lactamase domain protein [Halalkalicoccus jeotgali B3]ELY35438.1 beta-lactamase domain-containing protein [Halalkalicoccus jeotgali B3]